ncbi:MAG TPA: ferritin family protein [Desulfomonilia bacterium]|nr:ferritin family protein [Desulfomonilia bacterium]HRR69399.1 ferritin family protein [Desulfomonilia bacterium]HRT45952.1 ferritin family protein [Desulfomonilia bacterium]
MTSSREPLSDQYYRFSKGECMEEKRLGAYIDIAIQREEESYDFYTVLGSRLEDKGAKHALEMLAAEEKKHREFLEKYRDGGYGADALRMDKVIDYKIAEHMDMPAIDKDMKPEEVFLVAAHRELKSYNFYTGLAGLHPEGELKQIFLKMASQELKHKEKVEYLYSNTAFPQTDGG